MKKLLSMVLAVGILFTMSTNVLAFTTNETTSEISSEISSENLVSLHLSKIQSTTKARATLNSDDLTIKTLSDLSGNTFELVETGNKGYYIFDNVSGKYLEYTNESPSPYLNYHENLYYLGPTNYYVYNAGVYTHTILDNTVLDLSSVSLAQEKFDSQIFESRKTQDTAILSMLSVPDNSDNIISAYTTSTYEYVPSYGYIRNAVFPANTDGTCGYTASTIILNYWNKRFPSKNLIPDQYLDSNNNLLTTGYTLQDELRSYGSSNDTWALDIRDVLIDYCTDIGVGATSYYYIGKLGAFSEIQNDRPVILFGLFPDVANGGKVQHAVVGYGIETSGFVQYFVTHYGWENYTQVRLDAGLMGSNTHFRPH